MIPETLAKIALSPLLIAQGLHVRRSALILPEPPGPRSGHCGTGAPLRLLIIGDSSAAGVGAPSQQAALSGQLARALAPHFTLTWRLEARTGATTASAMNHLQTLETDDVFDIAVIALGVNDVTRNARASRWIRRQHRLHNLLRQRFQVRHIVQSGLPPMGLFPLLPQPLRRVLGRHAAGLDAALARLAADRSDLCHLAFDLPYRPDYIAADGFHPSPAAYALWADLLAAKIRARETGW